MIGMDRALIGTTLADRYEVQELIARGGMGRLYLAVQQPLGRTVVVKVMTPPQLGNTDTTALQARFFREAATCARLRHPNTVTLFDYGGLTLTDEGETFYMVMEHLDGRNLDEELQLRGRIDPPRALRIATQIARSLREAHDLGVVHRDLKPSNIMLIDGPDGEQVKVLDFGIAKVLSELDEESTEELTRKGDIVGSPSYMSPEQITHTTIDGRADIYSLGAMLFHLIAGRRPYQGRSATLRMMAHLHRPIPSIRAVAGQDIHPAVDALLQRCMAKDPDERYANVDALILALEDARRRLGSSITLQPTTQNARPEEPPLNVSDSQEEPALAPAQPSAPPPQRKPLLLGGIAVLMMLSLLAGVAYTTLWVEPAAIPEPDQPAVVAVVLASEPAGVQVHEGGALLGETPLPLTVPAAGVAARSLTLTAPGYDPLTVQLAPGETRLEPVALKRLAPQQAPGRSAPSTAQDGPLDR
jgi:serine/threonine-protein kinase